MTRSLARFLVGISTIAGVACGGSDTGPGGGNTVPFRVVAGAGIADTVQARLTRALTVEIHDVDGGSGAGRVVRFESLPPDDSTRRSELAVAVTNLASNTYGSFLSTTADSAGRAEVLVALGTVAGTARLRVSVPEFGLVDTVTYTVRPGATNKLSIGVRDTTVQPGATYDLRAVATDRFGNAVASEALTYSFGSGIASVSPTGQVTVGISLTRGAIVVAWKNGADTAHVSAGIG